MIFKRLASLIKNNKIQSVIILVLAIILVNTLLINPIIGRANNGDFGRLFILGGLSDTSTVYEERYDGFVHLKYNINYLWALLPWSTDWVFGAFIVKAAAVLDLIPYLLGFKLFDIRIQTVIYCCLFTLAVYLILKYKRFSSLHKIILGLFILLFFTDVTYIAYFNSFFGEAATIVFFFLTIGTYLHLTSKETYISLSLISFFTCSFGF